MVIGTTAILAFTLQAGFFRAFFRFALFAGAFVLAASYLVEWWWKKYRRGQDPDQQ